MSIIGTIAIAATVLGGLGLVKGITGDITGNGKEPIGTGVSNLLSNPMSSMMLPMMLMMFMPMLMNMNKTGSSVTVIDADD